MYMYFLVAIVCLKKSYQNLLHTTFFCPEANQEYELQQSPAQHKTPPRIWKLIVFAWALGFASLARALAVFSFLAASLILMLLTLRINSPQPEILLEYTLGC